MRKVKPYYFEYKSYAKGRWLGRPILEVFSSEFRDRSIDYYVKLPIFFRQQPMTNPVSNSAMPSRKVYLRSTINK